MLSCDLIARWPGKSKDERGLEHPAIYHMLDVAAVAEILLCRIPMLPAQRQAMALLVALHDLGKINDSFRAMLRQGERQNWRHWELTEAHLKENQQILAQALKVSDPSDLFQLFAASAGHHGRPSDLPVQELRRARKALSSSAREDAALIVRAFCDLWPEAKLESGNFHILSWWLSGLTTAADWIGSNRQWFPSVPPDMLLSDYLSEAREKAQKAVAEAGLIAPGILTQKLFDWENPRPMQTACEQIPLHHGPKLAIIEDETGAGKTEAALILAQRILSADNLQGIFFALPTMATADAMFSRLTNVIGRLFDNKPSVTLAHGRV